MSKLLGKDIRKKLKRDKELVSYFITLKETLEATGKKFNITRERARQIIMGTISKEQYNIIKKENQEDLIEILIELKPLAVIKG